MYVLLYRSRERPGLLASDLNDIIESAQRRNRALDVPGLLLSGRMEVLPTVPGEFVQWIEGSEGAVEGLFETIAEDPRHTEVEVLARGPIDDVLTRAPVETAIEGDRLFPTWSMGLVRLAELPATRGGFLRFAADWDGQALTRAA